MKTFRSVSHKRPRTLLLFFVFVLGIFSWLTIVTQQAQALGILDVSLYAPSGEPLNAYNLIVDSNVTATSTGAPNVATVAVRFCNTGDMDLTNVWGYIGDFGSTTPGMYPTKVDADFSALLPSNPFGSGGTYSFTHLGSNSDASRFIGTIPAGDCSVQYWHFSYPQCENVGGVADVPPCNNSPAWGDNVKAGDDMSLNFDVWGTSDQGSDNETWTMWMRNEISAMANKIKPNPDGVWFNTDTSVVYPGETVTTNGVLYEFGNINQGFDNSIDSNGDGVPDPAGQDGLPDYNAWAQPVGNPSYDPACFQLVGTETELFISRSGGLPDLTLTYKDQLYFTDLPANNTGVRGIVKYTFLALNGACFSGLSPYQEVASGSDNEKFNGDYGTGIPPLRSFEAEVGIDKSSAPTTVPTGSTTTYKIPFWNNGGKDAGLYLSSGDPLNLPLVIKDTVPNGMQYVCGSASNSLYTSTPDVPSGVTIYYSKDSGSSWSTSESSICGSGDPTSNTAGGNEIVIQWWLNGPLPANKPVTNNNFAGFQARVPGSGYTGPNFIENCATAHFGTNGPAFDEACATIIVPGLNTLGDFVWRDLDNDRVQDGGNETGIDGVTVSLYHDANGNGVLDDGELLVATMETSGGGAYDFTQLPDARYIVVVDTEDPSIPTGYYPSTYASPVTWYAVNLIDPGNLDYNDADFGFAPSVNFDKVLTTANPSYEGDVVRYNINITNNRSGNGEPPGSCVYNVWGQTAVTGTNGAAWLNPTNAQGAPNGTYATGPFSGNSEDIYLTNFTGATVGGTINQVYVAVPIAVLPSLAGTLDIAILNGTGATLFTPAPRDAASLSDGTLYIDVTSAKTWVAADFAPGATTTRIQLTTNKTANPSGDLYVDAVGYRVTTSQLCGSPADTINYLPLTDTFDNLKLQFLSANPPVTSVSGGTLTWDNVGPIYAGQTKSIIVRFVALQPPDLEPDGEPDPTTHTNCSATAGGTFKDGASVNSANDCVTHGINPGGEIGDTVWYNSTVNGTQDSGEFGIPNVVVNLCPTSACAIILKSTTTDSTGYYLFKGVPDGTYYVKVDTTSLPTGATWTNNWDDNCGTAPCGDSTTGAIVINANNGSAANDNYYGADFGYVTTGSPLLIGTIWHDRDGSGDGIPPDANEEGLAGITVYVVPTTNPGTGCAGGTPPGSCATAETDPNGNFIFTGLSAKTYNVFVLTNTGPLNVGTWSQTYDSDGTGVGTDNQVNRTLVNGTVVRADYSYRNTQSLDIGDTVFVDWNGNAVQDSGEEGLQGVTVRLYRDLNGDGQVDSGDLALGIQTTNSSGNYLFTGLPGSTNYIVVVDQSTLPAGYAQTLDPNESGVCLICDSKSSLLNLTATNLLQDFAYKPTGIGSIGDYVWRDTDGDGIQDSGEPAIPSITVTLYEDGNGNGIIDAGDAVIATTQTDSSGNYLFTGLPTNNKNYLVRVDATDMDLPAGYRYPSTPTTVAVTLTASNPTYLDADFGFTGPARVGDYVWQDLNGDGEQDSWEVGINGVAVALRTFTYTDTNNNGSWDWGEPTVLGPVYASTTTAAGSSGNGFYEFTNLPPGDYAVVVTPPANHTNTGDPDAIACNVGCDNQTFFHLQPGQTDLSRDFGYQPTGLIGDYIWEDIDGDGVQDPTEPPLAGVTVNLSGAASASTTTNAAGYYFFQNVVAGTHTVSVNETSVPTGYGNALNSGSWTRTYDRDNGTTTPNGVVSTIVMNSSGSVTSVNGVACTNCNLEMDFGYRQATEISGTVFYDGVDNGNPYDGGTNDIPYPNITVYLYDQNGDWYATTTTGSNGRYQFYVPSGGAGTTYTVRYDATSLALAGMTPTYEADDSTCNACNGATPATVIGTTPVQNRDFGFKSATTLDCGDLDEQSTNQPAVFNTTLVREGACHANATMTDVLRLGPTIDLDSNGQPTSTANGDDANGDDEDGIQSVGQNWTPGATVVISATVNLGSSNTPGYLVGWFDWDANGQFDHANERIVYGLVTSSGTKAWSITLPSNYVVGQDIFVRFRLYDASNGAPSLISPTGIVTGGEVEDYFWIFGPTAVNLQSFTTSTSSHPVGFVSAIALLIVLTVGMMVFRRRNRGI